MCMIRPDLIFVAEAAGPQVPGLPRGAPADFIDEGFWLPNRLADELNP